MADAGGTREATGPTRTACFVHKSIAGVGNGLSFGFNELGKLWGVNIYVPAAERRLGLHVEASRVSAELLEVALSRGLQTMI